MIESFAPRVLNKYKTLLGVDPQQFTLKRAEWDGEFWYVSFEQFYNGIPVYTGKFGFTLNSDGNIISIGSDGHPGLDLSVTPQRNAAELVEIAKSRFNAENPDSLALLSEPVLLIYPDRREEEVKYHLAYKIELHDKLGGDRRRYFIDANTGDILFDRSIFQSGNWTVSGNVKGTYWPVNSGGSSDEAPARQSTMVKIYNSLGQQVTSGVTDSNGDYSISDNHAYQTFYVGVELKGSWSRIKNPNNQVISPLQSFVTSGSFTRNFNFSDTDDGFHVYHHMNIIHDFIKGSPFNYNGMDWQMEARIKDNSVANAAADGSKLYFSENTRNWWESSDVVYHEYTHNVVYDLYGGFIRDDITPWQDEAMDEGIADYFAATLNEDSQIDWINRDVDNPLRFPDDFVNLEDNQHYNGQILSGAMWDLESTTSQNTARKLNFKAMQITPQPDTFAEFVDNVILADDNNGKLCDGTPNYDAIIEAFETNHGIVPTLNVGQPLSVNITGPSMLEWKDWDTWTANVTGCSPFSYEWRFREVGEPNWSGVAGTSQQYTRQMLPVDMELQVKVTSDGQIVYDTHYVEEGFNKATAPVAEESSSLPEVFSLSQNYPNPFNRSAQSSQQNLATSIRFGLPEATQVQLIIFDLVGREVRRLADQPMTAGYHEMNWDGKDQAGHIAPAGVYFYHLIAGDFREWKKLAMVR
ncbi:PepSY domain-containing protein [bacterium]|nr:PepSY domain-containing protein [bacterium]